MIGRKRLFFGVALPALGLALANVMASPAYADACNGAVNTANSTTCASGTTEDLLTYVESNPDYVNGGDFTLRLDNHTADGIFFNGIDGGRGEIILQNGSELTFRGLTASADDLGNDLAIHVLDASNVGSTTDGINASALSGGDIEITVRDASFVSASGDGIEARSATGEIRIFTAADTQVQGSAGAAFGAGIRAESLAAGRIVLLTEGTVIGADGIVADGGDVTVITGERAIVGLDGDGIRAHAVDIVRVTANGTVRGVTSGIEATSIAGSGVSVTTAVGTTVRGIDGQGIIALALAGDVAVTANGDVFGGSDGIKILANGSISVITGASVVQGAVNGISAGGGDGVAVLTGENSEVEGGSNGIEANSAGGGAVAVTTGVNSNVTGGADGVLAQATSGAITVTMSAGASVEGGDRGIAALSEAGNVLVRTGAGSEVIGTGGDGIIATSAGGGTVAVVLGAGSAVSGGNDGVFAESLGGGGAVSVGMDAGADVNGDIDGIDARSVSGALSIVTGAGSGITGIAAAGIRATSSSGVVTITTGADSKINGGGQGISVSTRGAGTITINNNGETVGSGAGMEAASETGAIRINNTGTIRNLSRDADDLAILLSGGSATIENAGEIIGRIETGVGNDALSNTGAWVTTGTSNFGGGSDTVTNNNVIFAGNDDGAAEITTFVGLETLNNAGTIDLLDSGTAVDRLRTDGNYVGLGNAVLAVDASLGGAGSEADVLVVGGNTSGVTRIIVNNTSLGPGALNTDGILVVDVEGTADADDFVLANGPIDAGFFIYDLIFNDVTTQFLLVSEADAEVFEPVAAVAASQEIWLETAGTWEARQQSVRDRLSAGVIVTAVADPALPGTVEPENGLWFQALGSWTARNSEISGLDVSYDQSIYGFVAGADFGVDLGDDGTLLFGVLAGYIDSSLNFDANATSIKTDGATLGVYASLLQDGFFANILVQADLLNQTFSAPSLPGDTSDDADVTSIGGRVDLGYRFDNGDLFVEPMFSLDALSTSIDEFSVGGADIDAGTNESFRAGAGLRAGVTGERMTASLTGRVWNVFAADNEVTFTAGDTVLDLSDDSLEGLYGEVSGQIDVDLTSSTMLFVKGGVLFSDDITRPSVSGGFSFTW